MFEPTADSLHAILAKVPELVWKASLDRHIERTEKLIQYTKHSKKRAKHEKQLKLLQSLKN
ncbi:hypothetical protein [Geobacillus stearothermophilus]|uniref:hypothetical protein n=1 Tax=Geobacillus stearothermophilus TaxID=1422 RepID=UPI002E1AF448|nr:hypothetical protein [Geobacillus stearothermophilus]MED3740137.1 hypothetical protein [Geobacillus stearothermophilus]MED3765992.1 hypothetical protein [Geobacillus stearothermophilus]MED3773707.1 hypothetical protein [Geobacillus stearothermophilus]